MEHGRFEKFPGYDPERPNFSGERSGEVLSDEEAAYGRNFEAPKQFDNEDEKSRIVERDQEASELQGQLDEIDAHISATTQQLAALPLTAEQQALLDQINQLIAMREAASVDTRPDLDDRIRSTVDKLSSLPVTAEQGELLDTILEFMDAREKTDYALQQLFKR